VAKLSAVVAGIDAHPHAGVPLTRCLETAREALAARNPTEVPNTRARGRAKLDTTQATLTGTFPAHAALSDWKWGGWTDRVSRRSCARSTIHALLRMYASSAL
jgi:hypothetical protein